MSDYEPLSPARIAELAEKQYAIKAAEARKQDSARLAYVGGQPGAGKSTASEIVHDEMHSRGGFISLDADSVRAKLDFDGKKPSAEATQADSVAIMDRMRNLAIESKVNIVEERVFANVPDATKSIDDRLKDGYLLEMVALATPPEESLLGIYDRYERQHKNQIDNPRFVPEHYHEKAISGFEETLAKNEHKFDRIRVINRAGEMLFDSQSKEKKFPSALQALQAGRKLTDIQLKGVVNGWTSVKDRALARGVDANHLSAINKNIEKTEELKSSRIHNHAMKNVDNNVKVLAADPRFSKHNDDQLKKAAYFLGVHEKSSFFKGVEPDFDRLKDVTAKTENIAKLPDVEELAAHQVNREKEQVKNDELSL